MKKNTKSVSRKRIASVIAALIIMLLCSSVFAIYLSTPQPNNNIVCVEEGIDFYQGDYIETECIPSVLGINSSNRDKIAYIMKQNISYIGPYGQHPTQRALWCVFNESRNAGETYVGETGTTRYYTLVKKQSEDSYYYQYATVGMVSHRQTKSFNNLPEWAKLYVRSCNYSEFINNVENNSIAVDTSNYTTTYNENGVIIGPLKITSAKVGDFGVDFEDIKVKYNDTYINSKVKFCNSSGETLETNNGEFYILISYDNAAELSEKEIKFELPYKKYNITKTYKYIIESEEERANSLYYQTIGKILCEEKNLTTDVKFDIPQLIPQLSVELNKTVIGGDKLENIEFNITATQNGANIYSATKTTDSNGYIATDKITPNSTNDVTITIKETKKDGYKKLEDLTLIFEYDSANNIWKLKSNSNSQIGVTVLPPQSDNVCKIQLGVQNKAIIEKLSLLKLDTAGTKLTGAKFKVTFTNIDGVYGYSGNVGSGIQVTTNNGVLELKELEIADISKDIVIKLEEIEAPKGYKKLIGAITITLHRTGETLSIVKVEADNTISSQEFNSTSGAKVTNHQVEVEIKDIPVMNIGGIVWEDRQTGNKKVELPNNVYGENEGDILLSGIEVFLTEGEPAFNNGELTNAIAETKTAQGGEKVKYIGHKGEVETELSKGQYLFAGIEKKDNYYVVFRYDGMSYETVQKGTANNASKAEEIGRSDFNAKFHTIVEDEAISSKSGNPRTSLEYDKLDKESKLIHNDSNGIKAKYVMFAKSEKISSENWQETWTDAGVINKQDSRLNINCGLTYRFFDLAIGMDVYEAKLTINGKEAIYGYDKIINGELEKLNITDLEEKDKKLDEIVENTSTESSIIYNLLLYYSDYRYRISDYLQEGAINNNNKIDADEEKIVSQNAGEELKAYVTYEVIVKNQSTIDDTAQVEELAYYYDTNYKFVSAKDADGNSIKFTEKGTKDINGITKKYAEVSEFAKPLSKDNEYRQVLYITFQIDRNSEDYKKLEDKTSSFECANIVEILKYSTDKGLIDNDSAPGNIEKGYEDDTDEAQGINIKIKEEERIIKGSVWEDANKDGKNQDETSVKDVIVQLIEVKEISGKYYEYIWQETRSGSNVVRTLEEDGRTIKSYENSVEAENIGEYEFKEFIPGNYIVRFIYGDGSTYDITSNEYKDSASNVQKYNGQDYKSTIDPNYKAQWYNTATYTTNSVARDNEARRLEVMAYSVMIDEAIGQELENKTNLNKTWMAAETSRINVPVDVENGNAKTTESKIAVSFEYIKDTIEFKNMDFGLALRPQTKLELEKHITALKITPDGVGVQPVVEATANIEKIVTQRKIEKSGLTNGLSTILATRDNRGFWKVETDIEELAQGAELEVEYTYIIVNVGDIDYLSEQLVNAYEANPEAYDEYLQKVKTDNVKPSMKNGTYSYSSSNVIGTYLGKHYYTGNPEGDKQVLSRVEILEEAINNKLKFSDSNKYFEKYATEERIKYDTERNPEKTTIETVARSKESEILKVGDTDYNKTIQLTTVLSSLDGNENGNISSYIAEIAKYSNAAGRRNMQAEPENLQYVHSEDPTMTVAEFNEQDEFWAETIIITKPTGQNKLTALQITLITISAVAIIGVGIVLIKKFILK